MITRIRAKNFKSWKDTGEVCLAPLTGFFGTNSSGKTALLQTLLLMKQTVESARGAVLDLGNALVDFGQFADIVHGRQPEAELELSFSWEVPHELPLMPAEDIGASTLAFTTRVRNENSRLIMDAFYYTFGKYQYGMRRRSGEGAAYDLILEGFPEKQSTEPHSSLGSAEKCYKFSEFTDAVMKYYFQNDQYSSLGKNLADELEAAFHRLHHLGPLRAYPQRTYDRGQKLPSDVGRTGERMIDAILEARMELKEIDKHIEYWVRKMGLTDSYIPRRKPESANEYELWIKTNQQSPEVLITDVGFGVSQVLPVLVLCYYAPEGSTLVLEQPETHLHPSAQACLADVFIEVVKERNVQIILESHSEHLLHRLQRRVAECGVTQQGIERDKTAFYFCRMEKGSSILEELKMDEFGNISNWPEDFFGDTMGDLIAMTEAEMRRRGVQVE